MDFWTVFDGVFTLHIYFTACFEGWNPPTRRQSSSVSSVASSLGFSIALEGFNMHKYEYEMKNNRSNGRYRCLKMVCALPSKR